MRLAGALGDANRPKEACAALSQFDKLYAKAATAETRASVKSMATKYKCG